MGAMERAQVLARAGKQREAVAAIEEAAEAGDSEALLTLANWKLFGLYGSREPALADRLLARAADAGNLEAARMRAYLIGNSNVLETTGGGKGNPARARTLLEPLRASDPSTASQLAMLDAMPAPECASDRPAETLCLDPPVRIVRGLLTEAECAYLIARSEPSLRPSSVVDPRTGRRIPHPVRTSSGMSFGPVEEDLVVHALNRRIAAVTATEVSWGEPLHILRYDPGQEYKPHVDALPGVANQRSWTVLVYLNAGFQGGETRFTELDLTARGDAGDALIFYNVDRDGRADPRSRHAGLPVTAGVKWLATRWIRQAHYDPWSVEPA